MIEKGKCIYNQMSIEPSWETVQETNQMIDDHLKKHIRNKETIEGYIRKTAVISQRKDVLEKLMKHHEKAIKKCKKSLKKLE